ncbi:MAG: FecR family protein [Prevotella sp.]
MKKEETYIYEEVALRDHLLRRERQAPDVQSELHGFMQSMESIDAKRHKWRMVACLATAAAAVAALLVCIVLPTHFDDGSATDAIVAFKADANAPQKMTLQTPDGKELTVTQQTLAHVTQTMKAQTSASGVRWSLRTPSATTASLQLPDGSWVWLNANSRLIYPESFADDKREVEVTGEAFFEVAHDADRPFVVRANGVLTKVLGTKFNVRARNDKAVHVTLVEGSVEVTAPTGTVQTIEPGQDAMVADGSRIEVTEPDMESFTAWKSGEFYFDNATIAEIATEIGQWYNVSVIFNNPAKMQTRLFFAAERSETLDNMLRLLNELDKAMFTFEDNQIIVE